MNTCNICNNNFKSKSLLANHVRWNHKRLEHLVKCKYCNENSQSANIEIHEKYCIENPENETRCLYCNAKIRKNKKFCNQTHSALYNNANGLTGYRLIKKK